MAAFEQGRWRAFVARAHLYVASSRPNVVRANVEAALSRGREHGFESEYDLLRYCSLCFTLGSDFDRSGRYSWADEILASKVYSPRTKMDLLTQLANQPSVVEAPVEYDEPDEPVEPDEFPDEERFSLDEEVADFDSESEEPEELPDDIIVCTSEDGELIETEEDD
jgi:hypothetical protein